MGTCEVSRNEGSAKNLVPLLTKCLFVGGDFRMYFAGIDYIRDYLQSSNNDEIGAMNNALTNNNHSRHLVKKKVNKCLKQE